MFVLLLWCNWIELIIIQYIHRFCWPSVDWSSPRHWPSLVCKQSVRVIQSFQNSVRSACATRTEQKTNKGVIKAVGFHRWLLLGPGETPAGCFLWSGLWEGLQPGLEEAQQCRTWLLVSLGVLIFVAVLSVGRACHPSETMLASCFKGKSERLLLDVECNISLKGGPHRSQTTWSSLLSAHLSWWFKWLLKELAWGRMFRWYRW